MNNSTIVLKVKERLNKLDSDDSVNLECWQIVEAFNKFMVEWCRENLHGGNLYREGAEQSTSRIDDLQVLLQPMPLKFDLKKFDGYFQTVQFLPADYLRYSLIQASATSKCCPDPVPLNIYLGEEANVSVYLNDEFRKPNFDWRETFAVIRGNKINIYFDDFEIEDFKLSYYREPVKIQIAGCKDPYTNLVPSIDIPCEFKDNIVEILIAGAASVLAADFENIYQAQRNKNNAEEAN